MEISCDYMLDENIDVKIIELLYVNSFKDAEVLLDSIACECEHLSED